MGYCARLAGRAAFRQGNAQYCGYTNSVTPGMWSGGIVGLKSILGVKRRSQALQIMNELQSLGYISYNLDVSTKKLSYEIADWIQKDTRAEASSGTVYATEGYGFICTPRSITEKLAIGKRIFDESDAWLDLRCHTVYKDYGNAFSFFAPVIQYGKYGCALTLEQLGRRWGWGRPRYGDSFKRTAPRLDCLIAWIQK